METNDFLLYNEVLYRLHACRTMEELKPTLLGQLKLMIPYTYASFLSIQVDPETQELIHRDPFCQPRQFEAAERAWLGQIDQSYSIWLSHAPESMVVRDSEILSGDNRFSAPSYRKIYLDYHIYDCMQMNITYAGQAMGRLAFYRTQADGLFTDREAFLLRTLSNHIDLACYHCTQRQAQAVREHLSACPACRNEYEKLAQTLTLPSAPDLQEEDRRAFQAFRRHWKRKKLQVALLCVVLTAAVVIAGCVVYQEVEVVHDLFSPTTTVVLREAQTHGTWAPVPWEEGDRLRFEGLFAERAVTLDANSDSAVTLRVWDDQHNLVVDELTVAPGEEVSLKTLERNTDYQVEMQTEAEFACLRFH